MEIGSGLVVGTLTANIKSIKNGDNFCEFMWKGTVSGVVGGAVGTATAATGGVAAAHFGATGFIAGAATGAATGAVGGALGGASNAWLNGANFRDGFMAGMQGLWAGAATGFVTGGIGGGIDAIRHGGNFWSGDGAIYASWANNVNPNDITIGDDVEFTSDFANSVSESTYGNMDKYVEGGLRINETPDGYRLENGCLINNKTDKIANGLTVYSKSHQKSFVYLGKSAFTSCNQLKLTIGHEYIHATHYFMASVNALKNVNKMYGAIPYTELAAYNWEASMGVNNGYRNLPCSLGSFSWKIRPYFNWLLNASF